jgi:hypothetical protein
LKENLKGSSIKFKEFFCFLNIVLINFSNEGSHQSSNGDSNGPQALQLSRAVTVHPDSAQVMYFA